MVKDELTELIKQQNFNGEIKKKILGWVKALPKDDLTKINPTIFKKGDVYYHPIFNHPVVVLKKVKDEAIGVLLTSNCECEVVLEKCRSRHFDTSYLTKNLLLIQPEGMKFMGVFENNKQLSDVHKKLKTILN